MSKQADSDCAMCAAVRRLTDLVCEYEEFTKDMQVGDMNADDASALLQVFGDRAAQLLHEGILTTIGDFFMQVENDESGMSEIIMKGHFS